VKRLVALLLPLRSMKVAGRCRFCCCVMSRLYFLLFLSGTAGARQRGEHMDGLLRRFQSKGLLLRRVWAELAMSTERGWALEGPHGRETLPVQALRLELLPVPWPRSPSTVCARCSGVNAPDDFSDWLSYLSSCFFAKALSFRLSGRRARMSSVLRSDCSPSVVHNVNACWRCGLWRIFGLIIPIWLISECLERYERLFVSKNTWGLSAAFFIYQWNRFPMCSCTK
jgi:hypothetical protein